MIALGDFGEIRNGFQLRPIPPTKALLERFAYQLSDVQVRVGEGAGLGWPPRVLLDRDIKARDMLRPDEILLRSRGASYGAALVPSNVPYGTLAAAPLYILRVSADDALPEYVTWYINQPKVQDLLALRTVGSAIQTVPLSAFAELEIPLPPLEKQQQIAEADALMRTERETTLRLLDARAALLRSLLEREAQEAAQ